MTLALARDLLVKRLQAIELRDIPVFPEPDDFREIGDAIEELGRAVDAFLLECGMHAADNCTGMDKRVFASPVSTILSDEVIPELEAAARRLEDEEEWAA